MPLRVVEAAPAHLDDEPIVDANVELARDICGHDFPALYVRHCSSITAQARRFLNDAHDVEDVVQETFLRLFLAAPEIESEAQAVAFCRRVVVNLCIDRYRAARRRPQLIDLDLAACADLAGTEPDQVEQIVGAEDAAIVRKALASLTPLHRAALVKREIEEKPLSVIAGELDVPEESVKHLLFRARRSLRRLLAGTSAEPGLELGVDPGKSLISLAGSRLAQASGHGLGIAAFFVMAIGGVTAAFAVSGGGSSPAVVHQSATSFAGPGQHFIHVTPPLSLPAKHHAHAHRSTGKHSGTPGAHKPATTTPAAPPPAAPAPRVTHHPQHRGSKPHHHLAEPARATKGTVNFNGSSVPATVVSKPRTNVGTTRSISASQLVAPVGAETFMLSQKLIVDGSSLPRLELAVILPGVGAAPVQTVDTTMAWDQATQTYVVKATAPLSGSTSGLLQVHARYDAELQAPLSEQVDVAPVSSSDAGTDNTSSGQAS